MTGDLYSQQQAHVCPRGAVCPPGSTAFQNCGPDDVCQGFGADKIQCPLGTVMASHPQHGKRDGPPHPGFHTFLYSVQRSPPQFSKTRTLNCFRSLPWAPVVVMGIVPVSSWGAVPDWARAAVHDPAVCMTCPAAHYCPSPHEDPVPCPLGTYSKTDGAASEDACIVFPPGFIPRKTAELMVLTRRCAWRLTLRVAHDTAQNSVLDLPCEATY